MKQVTRSNRLIFRLILLGSRNPAPAAAAARLRHRGDLWVRCPQCKTCGVVLVRLTTQVILKTQRGSRAAA